MKRPLFIAMYLGIWVAVTAGVIYFGRVLGVQWWHALLVAYLLFVFVNGSMAYVSVKRRLEAIGERPPSYLMYLFFPRGIHESIAIPRVLRILVGVVIFSGGAAFGLVAIVLGLQFAGRPQSVGALALLLASAAMGAAFTYVGFRLVVMRTDGSLFKRPPSREPG